MSLSSKLSTKTVLRPTTIKTLLIAPTTPSCLSEEIVSFLVSYKRKSVMSSSQLLKGTLRKTDPTRRRPSRRDLIGTLSMKRSITWSPTRSTRPTLLSVWRTSIQIEKESTTVLKLINSSRKRSTKPWATNTNTKLLRSSTTTVLSISTPTQLVQETLRTWLGRKGTEITF